MSDLQWAHIDGNCWPDSCRYCAEEDEIAALEADTNNEAGDDE